MQVRPLGAAKLRKVIGEVFDKKSVNHDAIDYWCTRFDSLAARHGSFDVVEGVIGHLITVLSRSGDSEFEEIGSMIEDVCNDEELSNRGRMHELQKLALEIRRHLQGA